MPRSHSNHSTSAGDDERPMPPTTPPTPPAEDVPTPEESAPPHAPAVGAPVATREGSAEAREEVPALEEHAASMDGGDSSPKLTPSHTMLGSSGSFTIGGRTRSPQSAFLRGGSSQSPTNRALAGLGLGFGSVGLAGLNRFMSSNNSIASSPRGEAEEGYEVGNKDPAAAQQPLTDAGGSTATAGGGAVVEGAPEDLSLAYPPMPCAVDTTRCGEDSVGDAADTSSSEDTKAPSPEPQQVEGSDTGSTGAVDVSAIQQGGGDSSEERGDSPRASVGGEEGPDHQGLARVISGNCRRVPADVYEESASPARPNYAHDGAEDAHSNAGPNGKEEAVADVSQQQEAGVGVEREPSPSAPSSSEAARGEASASMDLIMHVSTVPGVSGGAEEKDAAGSANLVGEEGTDRYAESASPRRGAAGVDGPVADASNGGEAPIPIIEVGSGATTMKAPRTAHGSDCHPTPSTRGSSCDAPPALGLGGNIGLYAPSAEVSAVYPQREKSISPVRSTEVLIISPVEVPTAATFEPYAEEEATPAAVPAAEEEATPAAVPVAEEEATPAAVPVAEEEATPAAVPAAEEEATPAAVPVAVDVPPIGDDDAVGDDAFVPRAGLVVGGDDSGPTSEVMIVQQDMNTGLGVMSPADRIKASMASLDLSPVPRHEEEPQPATLISNQSSPARSEAERSTSIPTASSPPRTANAAVPIKGSSPTNANNSNPTLNGGVSPSKSPRRSTAAVLGGKGVQTSTGTRNRSSSLLSSPTNNNAASSSAVMSPVVTRPRTMTAGPVLHDDADYINSGASMSRSQSDTGGGLGASSSHGSGIALTRARSRTLEKGAVAPNLSASSRTFTLPSKRGANSSSASVGAGASSAGPSSPSGSGAKRPVTRQPSGSFRMQQGRPMATAFTTRGREEAERKRSAEEDARRAAEDEAARVKAEAEAEEYRKQEEGRLALLGELRGNERQLEAIMSLMDVRERIEMAQDDIKACMPTIVHHRIESRRQQALMNATSNYEAQLGEKRALVQHLTATIDVMGRKLPEWRSSLTAMLDGMSREVTALEGLTAQLADREKGGFSPSAAMASIREVVETDQDRFSVLSGILAKVKALKEEERHRDRELYALDELIEAATTSADKSTRRRERIAKAADYTDYTKLLHESSSEDDEAPSVEEMNAQLLKGRSTARHRSRMIRAGMELEDVVDEDEDEEASKGAAPLICDSDAEDDEAGLGMSINTTRMLHNNAASSDHHNACDDPKKHLKQRRAAERQVTRLHLQRMKAEHALEMRRLLQMRRAMVTTVKDQQVTNRRQGALGLSELFEKAIDKVKRQQQTHRSVSGATSLRQSFSAAGSFAFHSPSVGLGYDDEFDNVTDPSAFTVNTAPPANAPPATSYDRLVSKAVTAKIESLAALSEKARARIAVLQGSVAEAHMEMQTQGVMASSARCLQGRQMEDTEASLAAARLKRRDLFAERDALTRQLKVQRFRAANALKGQLLAGPAMRIVNGKPLVGADLWEGGAVMVSSEGAAATKEGASSGADEASSPNSKAPAVGDAPTQEVNVPEMAQMMMVRDLFDVIDIKLGLKDPREVVLGGRSALGAAAAAANGRASTSAARDSTGQDAVGPREVGGVLIQPPFVVTRHLDASLVKAMRSAGDVAVDDPFYATPEVLDIIYNRGPSAEGAHLAAGTRRGTTAIVRPSDAAGSARRTARPPVDRDSLFARLAGTKTAAVESRIKFTEEERAYRSSRDAFVMPVSAPVPKRADPNASMTPRRATRK